MNILISALLGAVLAGGGALLFGLFAKKIGLSEKAQRIGQTVVIVIAIASLRVIPIETIAASVRGSGHYDQAVEKALIQQAPYAAMKQYYPVEYAALKSEAVKAIRAGKSEIEGINAIRPPFLALVSSQMPKASDATISAMLDLSLDQTDFLDKTNPRYCFELTTTPARLSVNLANVLPPAMIQREMALMADVLRESATAQMAKAAPLSPEMLGVLAERAVGRLSRADAVALNEIDFEPIRSTTTAQMAASCHFVRAMLSEVQALPSAEVGPTYRGILALPTS